MTATNETITWKDDITLGLLELVDDISVMDSFNQTQLIQPETMDYQDIYKNFSISYALPLSNHDNGSLMAIAAFYALLFMFGTCGNAAILAVVHHVKATEKRTRHNTTLTYICILCVVDFLSMLPLPMTIIDQILGFWMFGTFACKLFRLLEHIGKIFSTFLLVAFSIDRYCAVCHPLKLRVRNQNMVYWVLGGMFGVTCVMLFPILLYAHSKELIIHEKFDMTHKTITRMHLYKCVDDLGDKLFIVFTLYCFVLAYAVPLLMMVYFYYGMLIRLFKQARAVRQSLSGRRRVEEKIPVGHIAVYTLAICMIHFLCWTPYWISVVYSLYVEVFDSASFESPSFKFIYFMYGVHALPYINSASNFILYGLLNRQLHQSPNGRNDRNGNVNRAVRSTPAFHLMECSDMGNPDSVNHDSTARTPVSEYFPNPRQDQVPLVERPNMRTAPSATSIHGANGFVTVSTTSTGTKLTSLPKSNSEEDSVIL